MTDSRFSWRVVSRLATLVALATTLVGLMNEASSGAAGAAGCLLIVIALAMLARHTTRSAPAPAGV